MTSEVIEKSGSILDKADEIMDEAVEKAGELLCTKPRIAEIILKQLLKCDPEHLAGLQLMGLCKHRMGENAEAVEIISTALELDPTNADNYNNLGLAYAGLSQYERSITAIEPRPLS
jgi:tetratricopeptide (TPR) repeat protein